MSVPWEKHRVTKYNPEKACGGYTLFIPYTSNNVWLIDMEGNFVHGWRLPSLARCHAMLLPNGHLLFNTSAPLPPPDDMSCPRTGWGLGGGLFEVDWEGNVVWTYLDKLEVHTGFRMDNGNTMIPIQTKVRNELVSALRGGIPNSEDRGMIWTEGFDEVTVDGKVVWQWSMADHLDPEIHVLCPLEFRGDYTHLNSCEVLDDGNILTSFRNIDTVCIIDKETGNIKWQWGPGEISHPHNPTMQKDGNILLFDNGAHRKNGSLITYSRVLEVDPITNRIMWEYRADPPQTFYSSLISGCQRLPNGNTLICEGMKGRLFEITRAGEIVWEFINPFYSPHPGQISRVTKHPSLTWRHSNAVFRAYRFTPDYPGLKDKDLVPESLYWVNRLYGKDSFEG